MPPTDRGVVVVTCRPAGPVGLIATCRRPADRVMAGCHLPPTGPRAVRRCGGRRRSRTWARRAFGWRASMRRWRSSPERPSSRRASCRTTRAPRRRAGDVTPTAALLFASHARLELAAFFASHPMGARLE
eukprot:1329391-Prymnesium_polylepis.1